MYPKLRDYTIRLAFVLTSFKGINCSLIGFLAGQAWRMRAIAKLFTNLYIMSHKIFFWLDDEISNYIFYFVFFLRKQTIKKVRKNLKTHTYLLAKLFNFRKEISFLLFYLFMLKKKQKKKHFWQHQKTKFSASLSLSHSLFMNEY